MPPWPFGSPLHEGGGGKDQIELIKNKQLPIIDNYDKLINKYCPELLGINLYDKEVNIPNTQILTKDFINGLFDGDGSLEVGLKIKNNGNFVNSIKFQIIQDTYNKSILEELISYFGIGVIRSHSYENSISYYCESKKNLINYIIPKLCNINLSLSPQLPFLNDNWGGDNKEYIECD